MKKLVYLLILVLLAVHGFSQNTSFKTVSLDDLSAFRPNAGNWFVVGKAYMDRTIDAHHRVIVPQPETKKKRRNKTIPVAEEPKAVSFTEGKGVLLNMNTREKKDHLVTAWEHGDIELELEVMLPRGSNSGIYLQGGYEVQLFDSWGVKNVSYTDIGGIYRNWETDPQTMYMGKPPLSNAARAPGLWQQLKISFRAPRFNAKGEKTANARFNFVELNGVRIHDNVEVPQLTGGPLDKKEKPTGPLMIQGDHGAVALRNIRYRLLQKSGVTLSDLTFKVFHGKFNSPQNFITLHPDSVGSTAELTWEVAGVDDGFGIVYNGTLNIDRNDDYQFNLPSNGGVLLTVDDILLSVDENTRVTNSIPLKKGSYPIQIVYYKNVGWEPPRLGLFVSGTGSYAKGLHSFNSYPQGENIVAPIFLKVGSEPRLLRAFLDFNGDREQRLTHTIAVGEPGGIHYFYDLKAGNIACVWRGEFLDATPMWEQRGDGSARPMGIMQFLYKGPSFAVLSDSTAAFPAVSTEKEFRGNGYNLDGRPVFNYTYNDIEVWDKIYPDTANRLFNREVSFKKFSGSSVFFKLAEGSEIIRLPDGAYAIDDNKYYISVTSAGQPFIRKQNGKTELVVKADGTPITYSIIW